MSKEKADSIKMQRCEDAMKMLQTEVTQIRDNCCEFLWCIDNWQVKMEHARNGIDKSICSDPFYSHRNGYKMCMQLDFGVDLFGDARLSLHLHILRSELDNILEWPFRHEITFELLNQETRLPHFSTIVKASDNPNSVKWKKPTKEKNPGIYFNWFISVSELSSTAALCKDNQMCIKVSPKIK